MIDWHSHILPHFDDGSKNTKESIALLKMLKEQGVKTVVATPHFLANDESVDDFLERRQAAFEKLKSEMTDDLPNIICGAEVKYYQGISKMADLEKLCIEGTDILLLEMSFDKWTEYVVREVCEISRLRNITVMIAHIERYYSIQPKENLYRIYESGALVQVNASYFLSVFSKHKALNMLKSGEITVIGSDCHGIKSRPPRIGEAKEIISKKLGEEFLHKFNKRGNNLLDI